MRNRVLLESFALATLAISACTPTRSAAPPEAPPTVDTPDDSRLGDEVRALDAIRTAASHGEVAEACARSVDYERSFPDGVLSEEVDVVKIELEISAGEDTRARDLGSRFLATHPKSPHGSRLRELLSVHP